MIARVTGLALGAVLLVVVGLGVAWALSEPEDVGFIVGVTVVLALLLSAIVGGRRGGRLGDPIGSQPSLTG